MRSLILIGASGLAREVVAVLEASDAYKPVGFLDDDSSTHSSVVAGLPVFGGIDDAGDYADSDFVVCTGRSRRSLVQRLQRLGIGESRYATVVAPSAVVPANCPVGQGSIVLSGVVLTADVSIGRHAVLMPRVVCTHDDRLGDYVTLCGGVVLGGSVIVGDDAYLGMNSSVRQNVRIAERAVLGMGAALLSDLPADETWAGNPAQPITHSGSRR
jgi:sugar O-acyltransferase (sialic acid O-acetyltransferase NeuD family)